MTHVRYRLGPPDKPINAQDSDAERKKRQKKKKFTARNLMPRITPQKKKREKKNVQAKQ